MLHLIEQLTLPTDQQTSYKQADFDLMFDQMIAILSNWRAAHAYPMQKNFIYLRKKARLIDSKTVLVMRLKRLPTILDKLERFPKMGLDRMQDIAGCRAVVRDLETAKRLKNSILKGSSRNKVHRVYDYVHAPKDDGYRGYHLVTKYGGTVSTFKNLAVEIQIRTAMQHAWATSVEIVDSFTKLQLKTRKTKNDWAKFFRLVSILFARREDSSSVDDDKVVATTVELLSRDFNITHVQKLLEFTTSSIQVIVTGHTSGYCLVRLASNYRTVEIQNYENLSDAEQAYSEIERDLSSGEDVVLASVDTIQELRSAYPNYFMNATEFVRYLQETIGSMDHHLRRKINHLLKKNERDA